MNEPLVLLPGMMCDARLFGPQIMAFGSERAIHLPPIGQHERIERIAVDVLNGAPDTFALAGLSFGGMIAMEVARIAPDRVTRLALMDTNPLKETPQVAADREPEIVRIMAGLLPEVMREKITEFHVADGPQHDEVVELILAMAMDQAEGVFVRQSRALQRRLDQQSTLRKLSIPTLVLCGEQDAVCPVKRHEFMAELIPTAELRVISEAGHFPPLEQPEATSHALRDWLAR